MKRETIRLRSAAGITALVITVATALSQLAGCAGPAGGCRDSKECARGYYCAGPNEPSPCGIPPREQCSSDADCGGSSCHAIFDSCSRDGVGSECRGPCTATSCGPSFRCNAKQACEPIPCDEGFTCRSHQRCDPAVAHAMGPVHTRTSGCVDIACTTDAACPTGKVCVNTICQDTVGACREDIPVP